MLSNLITAFAQAFHRCSTVAAQPYTGFTKQPFRTIPHDQHHEKNKYFALAIQLAQ
jgi:hypothetical protein